MRYVTNLMGRGPNEEKDCNVKPNKEKDCTVSLPSDVTMESGPSES